MHAPMWAYNRADGQPWLKRLFGGELCHNHDGHRCVILLMATAMLFF